MTNRPRQPLVDLPLRPGAPRPGNEPRIDRGPAHPRRPAGGPPPRRPPRRRRSRAWLWLLLLLLAAGGGGASWYFLLRPQPALALYQPATLDFGQQRVGQPGEALAVTVTNGGERPMRLESVQLAGEHPGDMEVTADDCAGVERLPGEACTIELRFTPSAAGVRRAEARPMGNLSWRSTSLPLVGVGIAPRAVLEPAALDFLEQAVTEASESQLVRIVNAGSAPLEIESIVIEGEHPDDFQLEERCAGRTFGTDERCAFRVAFEPRAAGARAAVARVVSDSVGQEVAAPLTGTGIWQGPPFTAEPASVDFGNQRRGRPSGPRTVQLINRTAVPRPAPELVAPRRESGFEIATDGCGDRAVAPGEGCQIELIFRPAAEGKTEGTLTVRESQSETVNIGLTGTGVAPRLALDRQRIDFGDLRVGLPGAPQAIAVRNTGTDSFTVRSARLAGKDGFSIARDRCSGTRLAPGARCAVEVAFTPERLGDHRSRLAVTSDAAPEAEEVELAGRGTASSLAVRPGSLEFGAVTRGESRGLDLDLVNGGTARLQVRHVVPEGAHADDFQVTAIGCRLDQGLAPSATCRLTVEFRPTGDGDRRATLIVDHDGLESPRKVPLSGAGRAPVPGFAVRPDRIGFGLQAVGRSGGGILTVTIRNTGKGDLVIRDFSLAGSHPGDFRIVPGTCQGVPRFLPESECTVGVRFTPQAQGVRRGELVIRHNAPGGRFSVRLEGTGG